MPLAVEHDEATDPPNVRVFCPVAVVTEADGLADAIEQLGRMTGHPSANGRSVPGCMAAALVRGTSIRSGSLPKSPTRTDARYAESTQRRLSRPAFWILHS